MIRYSILINTFLAASVVAQPTITPLDPVSLPEGVAKIISFVNDDGSTVFAYAYSRESDLRTAMRWDRSNNWSGSIFPSKGSWEIADIDSDGTTVAIMSVDPRKPYTWSEESGLTPLEHDDYVQLSRISRDGLRVLGTDGVLRAGQWVDGQFEPFLPNEFAVYPYAFSEDGTTVIGHDYINQNNTQKNSTSIILNLTDTSYHYPTGPTIEYDSYLYGSNIACTVAVGFGINDIFQWKDSGDRINDLLLPCIYKNGIISTLPTNPNLFYQYTALSLDESARIIGGYANRINTIDENVALVWIDSTTPVSLKDYLEIQGLETDGWDLHWITDISPDGRFLVGSGLYNQKPSVFIVDLPNTDVCSADLNNDGFLDTQDISVFMNALINSLPVADLTNDGDYDFFDISAFVTAFNSGCP